MTSLRTTLVGVTAASLLSLPVAASALTPTTQAPTSQPAAATAAARHDTSIRFLSFDRTRAWSRQIHIKGQVVARVDGRRGALKGVRVTLYRQLDGRSRWVELDTRYTSQRARPKFRFDVRAKANADYRVRFAGNRRFQPSSDSTAVQVYRVFNARLRDGSGRFKGRVQPRYAHRVIHLEKRRCADCGWNQVRAKQTGDRGRWRFNVGAPRSGRWWWRVTTPGSVSYIRSHSGVFTTELN